MVEICNECGQMFMTSSMLTQHKRMKHGFAKAEKKQKKKVKNWSLGIDWL